MPHKSHHAKLTEDEIDELLEPIRGWGHCWGAIAQQMIQERLQDIEQKEIKDKVRAWNKDKPGPYGDWPVDGH